MAAFKTARGAALEALCDIRRRNVFAADALQKACEGSSPHETMDAREASLAYHLTMTVMQNRMLLDTAIDRLRTSGALEPLVRDILRLGAAQLWFTRIPPRAAVSETVNLAHRSSPRAAGLVNALMRRLADTTPEEIISSTVGATGTRDFLALRYSFPLWLLDELLECLSPEQVEAFTLAVSAVKPVTLIENPLYHGESPECGQPHPLLENARIFDGAAFRAPGFADGRWLVADAGAAAVVSALSLAPGLHVWDACAAPGGKTFLSAMQMNGTGRVLATDISDKKIPKIREGAKRLNLLNVEARQADASLFEAEELFDAVLCDVPCSGLGVLANKPDIRYKDPAGFERLPEVQSAILENAAKAVKPGGVLVYSTCTFRKVENESVTGVFLRENPQFSREAFDLPFIVGDCHVPCGEITLWPHIHGTDGFYICKMRCS